MFICYNDYREKEMQNMLSKDVAFLEGAFDLLNKRYFESALSKSVITIQASPNTYGHFTCYEAWQEEGGRGYYEINISAESLTRPLEATIATLIHEMVHQYCFMHGIQDTSRGGTYHNKRFKKEAEDRGLIISHDRRYGWSCTTPSEELVSFCKSQWQEAFQLYRKPDVTAEKGKRPSSTKKYICPSCGQSVRATKTVHIICCDCEETMTAEN